MKAPREKHLEDWIVANPDKFLITNEYFDFGILKIKDVIGTQYKLPSGILDILAINNHGMILAFELKKDAVDSKTITQAGKYIEDLKDLWYSVLYDIKVPADKSNIWQVGEYDSTHGFHLVMIGDRLKQDNTSYICHSDTHSTVLYDYDGENYTFAMADSKNVQRKRKEAVHSCKEIADVFRSKVLELASIDATRQYANRWENN